MTAPLRRCPGCSSCPTRVAAKAPCAAAAACRPCGSRRPEGVKQWARLRGRGGATWHDGRTALPHSPWPPASLPPSWARRTRGVGHGDSGRPAGQQFRGRRGRLPGQHPSAVDTFSRAAVRSAWNGVAKATLAVPTGWTGSVEGCDAGGKGGRDHLEHELRERGITRKGFPEPPVDPGQGGALPAGAEEVARRAA